MTDADVKLDPSAVQNAANDGDAEPTPQSPHPKEFYDGNWKYVDAPTVAQRKCAVTLVGLGFEKDDSETAAQKHDDPRLAAEHLVTQRLAPQDLPTNCSWVVEGKLMAGSLPSKEAAAQMVARLGIRVFFNFMEIEEWKTYESMGMNYEKAAQAATRDPLTFEKSYRMRDFRADEKTLTEATKAIKAHMDAGRRVFIHCSGGAGRTGAVTAVFLGLYCGLSMEGSLQRAADMYTERSKSVKRIPESKLQLRVVRKILQTPLEDDDARTLENLYKLPKNYNGSQIVDYTAFAAACRAYVSGDDPLNY